MMEAIARGVIEASAFVGTVLVFGAIIACGLRFAASGRLLPTDEPEGPGEE
jgi:hypothetical protein